MIVYFLVKIKYNNKTEHYKIVAEPQVSTAVINSLSKVNIEFTVNIQLIRTKS